MSSLSAPLILLHSCLHISPFRLSPSERRKKNGPVKPLLIIDRAASVLGHREWAWLKGGGGGEQTVFLFIWETKEWFSLFLLLLISLCVKWKGEKAKQKSLNSAPGKIMVCSSPCARCIIKPKIEQWTEGGRWATGPSRRGQGYSLQKHYPKISPYFFVLLCLTNGLGLI